MQQLMQVVQGWLLGLLIDDCRRLIISTEVLTSSVTNVTSGSNSTSKTTTQVDPEVKTQIFYYCAFIVLAQFIYVQFINIYNFYAWRIGARIRTAFGALIYRKSLRLSSGAFRQTTPGQVVTMLSNDLMKIEFLFFFLPYPILAIIITTLVALLLFMYMGWLCMIAPVLLAIYLPFQVQIGRMYQRFRRQSVRLTDERLRLMGDFLPAMRLIKMYAWEEQFEKLVAIARRREISKIRSAAMLTCFNHGLFYVMAKCIVFVLLTCWLLSGGRLTAQLVFVASTLVGKMAIICGLHLPLFVMQVAHSMVAVRRLSRFFLLPEQSSSSRYLAAGSDATNKPLDGEATNAKGLAKCCDLNAVVSDITRMGFCSPLCFFAATSSTTSVRNRWRLRFQGITASYDEPNNKTLNSSNHSSPTNVLSNITCEARDATLTVVVGSVGAGKSSLLLCALNELHISRGQVSLHGRISYAPQEPWIFTGSVRENILFGLPMCRKRYLQVIRVCALRRDVHLFPSGDRTLVGERGVSLSGGQRARISLARCLYRQADVYLLDDPLSAVDAHVAKHVFKHALRDYLRDKCVILITHQLQVITEAEQLILMRQGLAKLQGPFDEVVNQVLREEEFGELQASLGQRSESGANTKQLAKPFELDKRYLTQEDELEDEDWARNIGLFQCDALPLQDNPIPLSKEVKNSIETLMIPKTNSSTDQDSPRSNRSDSSLSSKCETQTIPMDNLVQQRINLSKHRDNEEIIVKADNLLNQSGNDTITKSTIRQPEIPKVQEENNELSATWKAYRVYFKLGLSWWFAPLLLIAFSGTQVLYSIVDYWMSLWTDSEERRGVYDQILADIISTGNDVTVENRTQIPIFERKSFVDDYDRNQNMYFYSVQMILLFSLSIFRAVLFFVMCMRASVRLHDRLFERVIRAPVAFFDKNPVGILLNRVSRDLGNY
jgi:ABC-type multidrug transport system fused ATPase/permease subunit